MKFTEKFKNKEKLTLLIIILLLNFLSFAAGFTIGAKIFIPNPIIIDANNS
jgi:hypothetical protein